MKALRLGLMGVLVAIHMAALADAPELPYGRITISEVNATHTAQSGTSKLRFTVANDRQDVFHLLAITTPVARTAVLVGRVGPEKIITLDSASVPSDGVLDLNTSHLWVELSGLKRALVAGDTFPVELNFGAFRVSALAHVHEG